MYKRGYLLLEMMVALAVLATLAFIIAGMQAQLITWHRYAEQYLIATVIAQRKLISLQQSIPWHSPSLEFNVTATSFPLLTPIPCTIHAVTVSFMPIAGVTKKVVIAGASLAAKK